MPQQPSEVTRGHYLRVHPGNSLLYLEYCPVYVPYIRARGHVACHSEPAGRFCESVLCTDKHSVPTSLQQEWPGSLRSTLTLRQEHQIPECRDLLLPRKSVHQRNGP